MASLTFSNALLPLGGTDTAETMEAAAVKAQSQGIPAQGFLARLTAAMVKSRRRAAEREISRLELVYGFKLRPDHESEADLAKGDLPFTR